MKKTKAKSSPIWLIIFLCSIIVILVWSITSVRYRNTINLLSEEIQNLNLELEKQKQLSKEEIERIKEIYIPLETTASASPIATSSNGLETIPSTGSGEKE